MPSIKSADTLARLVKKKLNDWVDLSNHIEVPNSEIEFRASIPDLRNDLSCSLGSNRIIVQGISEVRNEYSKDSNIPGQRVFKPTGNDPFDQIRFVGDWNLEVASAGGLESGGPGSESLSQHDFVEIVWFGTDLIMLCSYDDTAVDTRATLDGGSEGGSTITPTKSNTAHWNSHRAMFTMVPVSTGQTLGLHVSKIRINTADSLFRVNGFDIYNDATQININPGVAFIDGEEVQHTGTDIDYDDTTAFDNSQTLGTDGGRVSLYLNKDGTIGRSLRDVADELITADFTGTVDHTNEEIIKRYMPRGFGAFQDGFGNNQPGTVEDDAFYLDDNQTALNADDYQSFNSAGRRNGIFITSAPDFITFNFVGTGLDVTQIASTTPTSTYDLYLDGSLTEAVSTVFQEIEGTVIPLYSGLDYGSHTVRIEMDSSSADAVFDFFNVYGPKKPVIPTDSMELCDYYLVGDYTANTTVGLQTIAEGVIRHGFSLEWLLEGSSWASGESATYIGGLFAEGLTSTGDTAKIWFYGTGFELRFHIASGNSADITIDVDGVTDFSGNTSSVYGTGATFTDTTGQLDSADAANFAGNGLEISGLTLGLHELTMTNNVNDDWRWEAFDVICPVHCPNKTLNGEIWQTSYAVGGQNLLDTRKFEPIISESRKLKLWIATSSDSAAISAGTIEQLMEDMCCIVDKEFDGFVKIHWSGNMSSTSTVDSIGGIIINGVDEGWEVKTINTVSGGHSKSGTGMAYAFLKKGQHIIQFNWRAVSSTTTCQVDKRKLIIVEQPG